MASRPAYPFPDAATAFVAVAWLGMLVGVSFLATPVKFQAPSLELPVALEVGHVTFAAFSRTESALSLLLAIAVLLPRTFRAEVLFAAVAILIVVVQAFWLLPILDARIEAVIAGQPLPPSQHHMLYALLEVVKALALAAAALTALFRLGWRGRPEPIPDSR